MATFFHRTDAGVVAAEIYAPPAGAESALAPTANTFGLSIIPFRDGSRQCYAAVVVEKISLWLNGRLVFGNFVVLEHQDEVRVGSRQLFFSAESTPVVTKYRHQGRSRRPRCPVCRGEILDGQPCVRCPGCSRVHHQLDADDPSAALNCWTYSSECRFCAHPTSLAGAPIWRPAEDDFFLPATH